MTLKEQICKLIENELNENQILLLMEKKSKFEILKKNKVPLTDEERKKCLDADAIWHHGINGAPSPAVWKSINPKTKEVTYITNTHRAYNAAPTLKGAIGRYHNFIKGTA